MPKTFNMSRGHVISSDLEWLEPGDEVMFDRHFAYPLNDWEPDEDEYTVILLGEDILGLYTEEGSFIPNNRFVLCVDMGWPEARSYRNLELPGKHPSDLGWLFKVVIDPKDNLEADTMVVAPRGSGYVINPFLTEEEYQLVLQEDVLGIVEDV